MGFKNGEFSFHVWHKDPKTGMRKWCGQFFDDKSALTWKKKQDNPDEFTINNIGPNTIAKGNATRSAPMRGAAKKTATQASAEARAESNRRWEQQQRAAHAKKRADEERKAADREAMAGVREAAEGLLEKHKADEADDLRKGINH